MLEVNASNGPTTMNATNASDNNGEGNQRAPMINNRTRNERRKNNNVNFANLITYACECPAVGAILGLKFENFHKKLPYKQFIDKINQFVLGNYKDGSNIKCLLKKLKNPVEALKKYLPEVIIQNASSIKKEIQKEEIKQYVARKTNLGRNIEKVFGGSG